MYDGGNGNTWEAQRLDVEDSKLDAELRVEQIRENDKKGNTFKEDKVEIWEEPDDCQKSAIMLESRRTDGLSSSDRFAERH